MLRVYCIYIAKSVTLLVDECFLCRPLALSVQRGALSATLWLSLYNTVFSLSPSGPLCAAGVFSLLPSGHLLY